MSKLEKRVARLEEQVKNCPQTFKYIGWMDGRQWVISSPRAIPHGATVNITLTSLDW